MNKSYLISSALLLSLFTGCSQKTNALNYFQNEPDTANAIQYTKKRDFVQNNEIKALIFVTYMNKVNKKYELPNKSTFIVGLHRANESDHDLLKNGYKVLLNNEEPSTVKALDTDSDLIKSIPLKNNWASYYLMQFEKKDIENKKLNLTVSHNKYSRVSFNFETILKPVPVNFE